MSEKSELEMKIATSPAAEFGMPFRQLPLRLRERWWKWTYGGKHPATNELMWTIEAFSPEAAVALVNAEVKAMQQLFEKSELEIKVETLRKQERDLKLQIECLYDERIDAQRKLENLQDELDATEAALGTTAENRPDALRARKPTSAAGDQTPSAKRKAYLERWRKNNPDRMRQYRKTWD
jgi:hypothetical protein